MRFKNKVLMIGFGSVARCALPILVKHIDVPYRNITVIDFEDKREELKPWIKKGVRFCQKRITPVNLTKLLSQFVDPGGLVIDLSWNIDCIELISWCHDNKVLYANTSVEEWDPYANFHKKTPFKKSLYYRQMEIRSMAVKWSQDNQTTAILDHGANPGLVSHFTKVSLIHIAQKSMSDKAVSKKEAALLERLIGEKKFPELAMRLGVKTIHISERDTQITNRPKRVDEFVGTWSIEGLREEGTSPAEIGWGTHENEIPLCATLPPYGPKNQIFLSQMGMNTWVRSWIPYQEIVGMVIRHSEAFTISDSLTLWDRDKVIYRPTVHYAYMPCDETITSLHELRCRNYDLQPKLRIMSDEVIEGDDILGTLLMGHRYNSWWTGSILSIGESRRLVPHQNATTVQVAIGIISAVMWMLENPNRGVCLPDDLPFNYILNIATPYLGKVISEPADWTPFTNYQVYFKENPNLYLNKKNPWSFHNFLFRDIGIGTKPLEKQVSSSVAAEGRVSASKPSS